SNPDDYFHFEGTDVTEQGLGEAARRRIASVDAHMWSFLGADERFGSTPLLVSHGLPEEPLPTVSVPNWWDLSGLTLAALPKPTSWREMLEAARIRFHGLKFSHDIEGGLQSTPFHSGIVELAFERLRVLQTLVDETVDARGTLSTRGLELFQ